MKVGKSLAQGHTDLQDRAPGGFLVLFFFFLVPQPQLFPLHLTLLLDAGSKGEDSPGPG